MKMNYVKPFIEVMDLEAEDIIRTSGLTEGVSGVSGGNTTNSSTSYDEAYNLTAGGKITLN